MNGSNQNPGEMQGGPWFFLFALPHHHHQSSTENDHAHCRNEEEGNLFEELKAHFRRPMYPGEVPDFHEALQHLPERPVFGKEEDEKCLEKIQNLCHHHCLHLHIRKVPPPLGTKINLFLEDEGEFLENHQIIVF